MGECRSTGFALVANQIIFTALYFSSVETLPLVPACARETPHCVHRDLASFPSRHHTPYSFAGAGAKPLATKYQATPSPLFEPQKLFLRV